MKPSKVDQLLAQSRLLRLEDLATRLLSGLDRSAGSLDKFAWELEEELNESLYVTLDLMGWSREALSADFAETCSDLDFLLGWFEEREEYECCAKIRDLQGWLVSKIQFFLAEIDRGEEPSSLIGL